MNQIINEEVYYQLLDAAKDGNIVSLLDAINNNADVNISDEYGIIALYVASWYNQEVAVQILLEIGADVNATIYDGSTSLYVACQKGNEEIVQILLDAGADVNIADEDNIFPIIVAAQKGHLEIVQTLLNANAIITPSMLTSIKAYNKYYPNLLNIFRKDQIRAAITIAETPYIPSGAKLINHEIQSYLDPFGNNGTPLKYFKKHL